MEVTSLGAKIDRMGHFLAQFCVCLPIMTEEINPEYNVIWSDLNLSIPSLHFIYTHGKGV